MRRSGPRPRWRRSGPARSRVRRAQPLSKDYLRGEAEEKPYVHPEAFYAENEIDLRTSTTVTALDPGASAVAIGDGEHCPTTACC